MSLTLGPSLLVGFCLALVRSTALVLICPPFNSPAIPIRVRAGTAVALSFVLARKLAGVVDADQAIGTAEFLGALVAQAIAGLAMGALVLVLFSAVQSAGELKDLQVGFSLGGVIDPLSGNMATPIGRLHQLLAIAIMFAIQGHLVVMRGLIRSIEVAPEGLLDPSAAAADFARLLSTTFIAALEIALPILAALLCAEVAFGLLGKAAPQLNILTFGFAVKTMLAFALLGTTLLLLPGSVESLVGEGVRAGLRIFTG